MSLLQIDLHDVGVDFGHLHGLADQFVEPRSLLVDNRGQVKPACIIESLALHQRGSRGPDGCERSAQLMAEGVDERSAQPLTFAGSFKSGRGLNSQGARECDRNLRADRGSHFAGENVRAPTQSSY